MAVCVDCRERALLAEFDLLRFPVQAVMLDVGDITITDGKDRTLIIERKTAQDLAASIKDGRYREQKQRLLVTKSDYRKVYVAEGFRCEEDPDGLCNGVTHRALATCVFKMQLREGICVFASKNVSETAALIVELVRRIKDDPDNYVQSLPFQCTEYDPITIKAVKAENMTALNVLLVQLSAVPKISLKFARLLAEKAGAADMNAFVEYLKTEGAAAALLSIPRIGPAVVKNLYVFLGVENASVEGKKRGRKKKVILQEEVIIDA
jgi:ERCC4-type nuclease